MKLFVLAAALVLAATSSLAQERIPCGGEPYRVQPGDSLSGIAQRAYSSFNYQVIFDANRDVLDDAALLVVGERLRIPCLDGADRPQSAAATNARAAAPVRTAALSGVIPGDGGLARAAPVRPAPAELPIRFLSRPDYAPFSDREAPEGGMITELLNRAMLRSEVLRAYQIAWKGDAARHMAELMPGGAHDVGFPWFRPDCARSDRLSDAMRLRCETFDFSEPMYEVVIATYVTRSSPLRRARSLSELKAARICRPEGEITFDLEALGLDTGPAGLVRADDAAGCFGLLLAGEVDAVSMDARLAEAEIAKQRLIAEVAEAKALASVQTLHAIAAKGHPHGKAFLAEIDRGLARLREEGVWFEVTRRHLAEHARSL